MISNDLKMKVVHNKKNLKTLIAVKKKHAKSPGWNHTAQIHQAKQSNWALLAYPNLHYEKRWSLNW